MAGLGSWIGMSMEMGALIAGAAILLFPTACMSPPRSHTAAGFLSDALFSFHRHEDSVSRKRRHTDHGRSHCPVRDRFAFLTIYPIMQLSGSGRHAQFHHQPEPGPDQRIFPGRRGSGCAIRTYPAIFDVPHHLRWPSPPCCPPISSGQPHDVSRF